MAILKYTGKNVLGICIANDKDTHIVQLLPGINEVDDAIYDKVKTHPLFKIRLDRGIVTQLNVEKNVKQSIEDMLVYIPEIYDVKLLRKIINEDGRDRVITAAKDQLDKIKNPKKAAEEAKGEHFS